MSSNDISDNRNYLPAYFIGSEASQRSRDSILSSRYPSGGSRFSIRTGSSRAQYALESGSPPTIPPRGTKTAASEIARKRLPKIPHRHPPLNVRKRLTGIVLSNSNYQQISQGCLLFQRRFLVVLSLLALCITVCCSTLIGYKAYKEIKTRHLIKSRKYESPPIKVNSSNEPFTNKIPTTKYTPATICGVFGQVYFSSKLISEKKTMVILDIDTVSSNKINGVNISNGNSLRIIHPGQYYVYSNVHYRITQSPAEKHEHWKHYIKRQSEDIAVAAYTCGYDCLDSNRTSYIAGLYQLCADDVISIGVSGSMLVYNEAMSTITWVFL
ncbi:hypothetical protein Btru_023543 [Bulinus truncatus]|nr:hypothetical protein Btru_023543 [Bulinus truncatus]